VNALGQCVNDPCEQVGCGQDQKCVVLDDGTADCESPVISGIASTARASGGGMFSCSFGTNQRPGLAGLAFVLLTGALVGRRRGKR
jgi:hypothetical protein